MQNFSPRTFYCLYMKFDFIPSISFSPRCFQVEEVTLWKSSNFKIYVRRPAIIDIVYINYKKLVAIFQNIIIKICSIYYSYMTSEKDLLHNFTNYTMEHDINSGNNIASWTKNKTKSFATVGVSLQTFPQNPFKNFLLWISRFRIKLKKSLELNQGKCKIFQVSRFHLTCQGLYLSIQQHTSSFSSNNCALKVFTVSLSVYKPTLFPHFRKGDVYTQ